MISARMTPKAEAQMERLFVARRRAVEILDYVVSEWNSDPQSVACFDLRIVAEARRLVAEIKKLDPLG